MGAFLDKPKTEKFNDAGSGNGLRFGLASMQGWRVEMEDAHCAYTNLDGAFKDWSFFAVFDGHAGAKVSAFCAERLLQYITSTTEFVEKQDPKQESSDAVEQIRTGLRAGFLRIDEEMRSLPEIASGEDKSGSTAVCVLISPTHIYFANCGDSRAMLVRGGQVVHSTCDHKPHNPTERERIVNAGGSVMIQRVNGSLAVSRALGDYEYKNVQGRGPCEQLVSPEPEISIEARTDADEFVVLACDGVWDVMSNEDLCVFTRYQMRLREDLALTSNLILDTCLNKGSKDNMSIVVVAFPGCPGTSSDAVEKNRKLDARLEQKVQEIFSNATPDDEVDLAQVLHELSKVGFEDLPPGGLVSKQTYIESLVHKYRPVDQQQ